MWFANHEFLGVITTSLKLLAFIPYFWSLRSGIKPHFFTWFVWGLMMAIAFAIQINENAGPGAWITAGSCIAYFSVAVFALLHGEKNITKSDIVSVTLALSAIPLWCFTHNPLLAVLLLCLIDVAAYYPTWRKSWSKPYEEPILPYGMSALALIISLAALDKFSFTTALYTATLGLTDALFVVFLIIRRKKTWPV